MRKIQGILLLLTIMLSSCGNQINKRISMGLVEGWEEGTAMTSVIRLYLEEKGYHIITHKAAANLLFASMQNGDTDLYMDVWLPRTHGDKIERFNRIEPIGTNYNGALMGLVVPDYVDINSIEELNENAEKFNGQIIGIERGSGISAYTDSAIIAYDLQYTQLNSSTVAMAAELDRAISEKRWIVITGWQPHWLFGRFDLKFLADPKKVYGEEETLETYSRPGFSEDYPEVSAFLKNVYFSKEHLADLLIKMQGVKSKDQAVREWIDQNRAMIDAWWNGESELPSTPSALDSISETNQQ